AKVREDRKIFNNAAQAWNHVAYWEQMRPGGAGRPEAQLAAAIDRGSGVCGTGWVWLTRGKDGKLALKGYQDADNPMAAGQPALLGIDVWEHAYYLDYENRRKDHVAALIDKSINWSVVAERMTD